MGDVVNLKRIRKRTAQDQASQQAEVNRVKFGRTKTERGQQHGLIQTADHFLEQHRLTQDDS
ncbi:MAG: hypothetical protein JWP21_2259 [Tardiphaga sp.]|nr:hypothetical protein [Tardiphaga sp.]MDB5548812.1 hypothetical protein [Tardiphaga sp.]